MVVLVVVVAILIITYTLKKLGYISEQFSNTNPLDSKTELLVFVSKTCPHCVNYNENLHDGIVALAKSKGVEVKRIFADNDPNKLFDKYNVVYVPTGIILKDGKIKINLGSNINPEVVKEAITK